ncbi:GDSL esterase/lipase At3g43570 [Linum perenne]
MNKSHSSRLLYYIYFVLFINAADAHFRPVNNNSVTAVLVFGDSTVDAGNNNFVPTTFKGNFPPYGQDFAGGEPTGRFSNGRLTTDFIASYVGVKENVPPYLDPSLTIDDLKTGVSFASAGTGFDPLTPTISALIDEGARRILLSALAPMGCLPIVITIFSKDPLFDRQCLDQYTQVAIDYNRMLRAELNRMKPQLDRQGVKIDISDVFRVLSDLIYRPQTNGLDEVDVGCCGTGLLETGFLCNPGSLVCPDASKYIFWDSIHPTEKTYYRVFKVARPLIDMLIKD